MRLPFLFFVTVPVAIVAACGGGEFGSAASDAGADDGSTVDAASDAGGADGCVPKTCAALHWSCGTGDDGCGKQLDCGQCHIANYTCGGGGVAHTCACKPKTCFDLGFTCGTASDGCGGTLNCGTCTTSGYTCGGGGMDHRCGLGVCVPKTCQEIGATCGTPSDGCGGTLSCGSCAGANDVCSTSFQCQCVPSSCGQLGWQCGGGNDGCGGMLSCGGCSGSETCTNHACVAQGCTPTTSCAAQGHNCGAIFNGCGVEQCGPGPNRNSLGDVQCTTHMGQPNYYACPCVTTLGLDAGTPPTPGPDGGAWDSGMPPVDSGTTPDSGTGMCMGVSAPEPPFPMWQCTPIQTSAPYVSFCCAQ